MASVALPQSSVLDDQAREILSRPEYQLVPRAADAPAKVPQWLSDLIKWLEPLAKPFLWLFELSPLLYYMLLGCLIVLTGYLIYRLARALRLAFAPVSISDYTMESTESYSLEDLEGRIRTLSASGRWVEALRWLVMAAIYRLEPKARKSHRGTTNRAYLLRCQKKPTGPFFAVLVEAFDRCWYGGAPFEAEDFDRCQQAYRALISASEGRPLS